jgi:CheY-like chemotaxis protein
VKIRKFEKGTLMSAKTESIIVMVEDDRGHARLIEKNLRRHGIDVTIIRFEDGKPALEYIFHSPEIDLLSDTVMMVVLLDLNLPVLDGYEVLRRLREDQRTRHMPIIVFTSTDDEEEMDRCYSLGCDHFVTKPMDYGEFMQVTRELGEYISRTMSQ